jgi:hypothetical protein
VGVPWFRSHVKLYVVFPAITILSLGGKWKSLPGDAPIKILDSYLQPNRAGRGQDGERCISHNNTGAFNRLSLRETKKLASLFLFK